MPTQAASLSWTNPPRESASSIEISWHAWDPSATLKSPELKAPALAGAPPDAAAAAALSPPVGLTSAPSHNPSAPAWPARIAGSRSAPGRASCAPPCAHDGASCASSSHDSSWCTGETSCSGPGTAAPPGSAAFSMSTSLLAAAPGVATGGAGAKAAMAVPPPACSACAVLVSSSSADFAVSL
eukprot:353082-Chlamydomonas_euryale.AAC.22